MRAQTTHAMYKNDTVIFFNQGSHHTKDYSLREKEY